MGLSAMTPDSPGGCAIAARFAVFGLAHSGIRGYIVPASIATLSHDSTQCADVPAVPSLGSRGGTWPLVQQMPWQGWKNGSRTRRHSYDARRCYDPRSSLDSSAVRCSRRPRCKRTSVASPTHSESSAPYHCTAEESSPLASSDSWRCEQPACLGWSRCGNGAPRPSAKAGREGDQQRPASLESVTPKSVWRAVRDSLAAALLRLMVPASERGQL